MADNTNINRQIVTILRRCMKPERIILFGSRARRQSMNDSDFDLLVIQDSAEPRYRRSAPAYAALADLPYEVDIVVYTPAEVAEWSSVPESLVGTALREGIVLYEGGPG